MTHSGADFQAFVQKWLSSAYDGDTFENVYEALCQKDERFRRIVREQFNLELLSARLALSCLTWEYCMRESGIDDAVLERLFLKTAMNCFQSPSTVGAAAAFSDYYYYPVGDAENSPSVAVALRLLGKLKTVGEGDTLHVSHAVRECVKTLVEFFEGSRIAFENAFDAFMISRL